MFLYTSAVGGGGNVYSYLCRFLSFPLFFSLSLSFSFSFSFISVSQVAGPHGIFFFSFSVRLSASKHPRSPINSNFFSSFFFSLVNGTICKRYTLTPITLSQSSNHVTSYAGRWSTSGWGGNAHFLPPQEYDRGNGENRRTNEQTRTKLGVNQEQRKVCNTLHSW